MIEKPTKEEIRTLRQLNKNIEDLLEYRSLRDYKMIKHLKAQEINTPCLVDNVRLKEIIDFYYKHQYQVD